MGRCMPDPIRTDTGFQPSGRQRRARSFSFNPATPPRLALAALYATGPLLAALAFAGSGFAQERAPLMLGAYVEALANLDDHALAGLALFLGVVCFAVVTSVMLVRTHDRLRVERARASAESAGLEGEIDRLLSLLLSRAAGRPCLERQAAGRRSSAIAVLSAPDLTAEQILTYTAWLRAGRGRWRLSPRSIGCSGRAKAFPSRSPRRSAST